MLPYKKQKPSLSKTNSLYFLNVKNGELSKGGTLLALWTNYAATWKSKMVFQKFEIEQQFQ